MNYPIKLQGFEGQSLEVRSSGIFSGYKLFVNGQPAPKGPKRGQMLLRRNDGMEVVATWVPQVLGLDVPRLQVQEQTLSLVQPLQWYEWLWGGLPILLIFVGGALGGVLGFLAFSTNAKIFRAPLEPFVKYLATGAISMTAVLLYFGVVFLISAVLQQ